ncbi:MAG TPA: hypothetical protein VGD90_14040 [Sphingobacteriaceae bacterium]
MLRNSSFSVAATSLYLLVYLILLHVAVPLQLLLLMLTISPVLILWMVYTVLKHGVYTGRELEDDEEWGYEDRKKENMGVFF